MTMNGNDRRHVCILLIGQDPVSRIMASEPKTNGPLEGQVWEIRRHGSHSRSRRSSYDCLRFADSPAN